MRARAATPSQVCSAPSWHTPTMGTLVGSPPRWGGEAPPCCSSCRKVPGLTSQAGEPKGLRICVTLGLSPHCSKGQTRLHLAPRRQSACSEACFASCPQAWGLRSSRGPARHQVPTVCRPAWVHARPAPAMFSRHLRSPTSPVLTRKPVQPPPP